jgi:pimeloyl-ACP methyl ester carboxylesterase
MAGLPLETSNAFFLTQGGQRLFACLHPARGESSSDVSVVICSALTDEHIGCYRVVYELAEYLAAAGLSVLRVDPPGHGDSEGELADATPQRLVAVAKSAADVLRERSESSRSAFLGIRLGSFGALEAAQTTPGSLCVTWAPILSAQKYFRDLLRRQVLSDVMYGGSRRSVDALLAELDHPEEEARGMDLGGYLLTGSLYRAFCATDLPAQLAQSEIPRLVIQQNKPSAGTPRALLEQVAKSVSDHHSTDAEVFWNFPRQGSVPPTPRQWFEITRDWLLQNSGRASGGH